MTTLSLIAALSNNQVIGKNNQLPWHLPADLKHFKEITLNKPVIMGRKTFESIGKALPNRQNIVITRQRYHAESVKIYSSIDTALLALAAEPEVMIIGGADIYRQTIMLADRLYLTLVDINIDDGDAYFPAWSTNDWRVIESIQHHADEKNNVNYTFLTLERRTTHLFTGTKA